MSSCIICHLQINESSDSFFKCLNGHPIHKKCLAEWLLQSQNCPLCSDPYPHSILEKFKSFMEEKEQKKQDALEEKAASDLKMISKQIKINSYCSDNEIIISVEDNGIGIPLNKKKDIFQPFFSSKKLGHGSGLGLSISLHLVQEMNGTIDIDSSQYIGTKVFVRLPKNKQKG